MDPSVLSFGFEAERDGTSRPRHDRTGIEKPYTLTPEINHPNGTVNMAVPWVVSGTDTIFYSFSEVHFLRYQLRLQAVSTQSQCVPSSMHSECPMSCQQAVTMRTLPILLHPISSLSLPFRCTLSLSAPLRLTLAQIPHPATASFAPPRVAHSPGAEHLNSRSRTARSDPRSRTGRPGRGVH